MTKHLEKAKRLVELLLEKHGGNQSEFAREVGVTPQAVSLWLSGDSSPRGQNLNKVAELLGTTAEYLQTGKGDRRRSATHISPVAAFESLDKLPTGTMVLIPQIGLGPSAEIVEIDPLPFPSDYIRGMSALPGDLATVKVPGGSMEHRLFDGDYVIIGRADVRIPTDGGVFALVCNDELMVKRLFKLHNGGIRVKSDNEAGGQSFDLFEDQESRIRILGRVKYRWGAGDFL